MTNEQADAFLKGFQDELEKNGGFIGRIGVAARRWGRAITGKSGRTGAKGGNTAAFGQGGAGPTRSELAGKAWKSTKKIVQNHPVATAATVGGAGVAGGYAAS